MLDRILAMLVGAVLAGVGAAVVETAGAPGQYALVAGIALGMPLLVFSGWQPQFDVAAYWDARWPRLAVRDAVAVVAASAFVGGVLVAVAGLAVEGSLLFAVAAGGTFAGGYATTFALAHEFRR